MKIARRTIRSTPFRNAVETWQTIIDLLTREEEGERRDVLNGITGIAASLITETTLVQSPMVVTSDSPRTHVYCLHNDEAIEDSKENEAPLGFDPLEGDWHISFPCPEDDLAWAKKALEKETSRITVRDEMESLEIREPDAQAAREPLTLDPKRLLDS